LISEKGPVCTVEITFVSGVRTRHGPNLIKSTASSTQTPAVALVTPKSSPGNRYAAAKRKGKKWGSRMAVGIPATPTV
jgi:hypothetical protein